MENIIAEVIIEQLGGSGRLSAMVDARAYTRIDNGIRFQFSGSRKMNVVDIVLTEADVYNMVFYKMWRASFTEKGFKPPRFDVIRKEEGVYAEDLRPTFEEVTGLALRL